MKFVIIRETLRSYPYRACHGAVRFLQPLFPIIISVDPEDNLNLALRLISYYENTPSCTISDCGCRRYLHEDLFWFLSHKSPARCADFEALRGKGKLRQNNVMEVMQALSFIADKSVWVVKKEG